MSEINKNEVKTPYHLSVNKGTVYRDEDGQNIKRTAYSKKLGNIISSRLRNDSSRDVELSAVDETSVSNMVKALIYAQASLSAYGKKLVVKNISFKPMMVGKEKEREIITKAFLVGVEDA